MSQATTDPQKTTSRKVKALLAGGLVLGVGAAVTLAAWTDQEWAEGIFGAGSFNIESSSTGEEGSFDDHESEGEAVSLDFDLTGADNMAPGDTVASPFVMRLDANTTYDAEVVMSDVTAPAESGLTYGLVAVDSPDDCTAAATGTEIIPAGTALNSTGGDETGGPTVANLTAGAETEAGAPATLCFQVTADDDLAEGSNTTATWQFTGTSAE